MKRIIQPRNQPMVSQHNTLGQLIADLMNQKNHSNRSLAAVAGVSDTAIRNLLKFGLEANAKDPDARTLRRVADALGVDALKLFRLAGYVPPQRDAFSVRAEYLAETFDELPPEKQDAVLGVIEAMADKMQRKAAIRQMRSDPKHPLAGIDLSLPNLARLMANHLIAQYQMTEAADIASIEPDAQVLQYKWSDLPQATQQRVKALIRHKLSLDYDATMVDPEWRE